MYEVLDPIVLLQFKTEITVKEDAQQFSATVSSALQEDNDGSIEEILCYTLKSESMATAQLGSYSGTSYIYTLSYTDTIKIRQRIKILLHISTRSPPDFVCSGSHPICY